MKPPGSAAEVGDLGVRQMWSAAGQRRKTGGLSFGGRDRSPIQDAVAFGFDDELAAEQVGAEGSAGSRAWNASVRSSGPSGAGCQRLANSMLARHSTSCAE